MASRRVIAVRSGKEKPAFVTSKLVEAMSDDQELIVFLNATAKLSDRDFALVLHQNGVRVALWMQRKMAFAGNKRAVDALETYIDRGERTLNQATKSTADDGSIALPAYKPRT